MASFRRKTCRGPHAAYHIETHVTCYDKGTHHKERMSPGTPEDGTGATLTSSIGSAGPTQKVKRGSRILGSTPALTSSLSRITDPFTMNCKGEGTPARGERIRFFSTLKHTRPYRDWESVLSLVSL